MQVPGPSLRGSGTPVRQVTETGRGTQRGNAAGLGAGGVGSDTGLVGDGGWALVARRLR